MTDLERKVIRKIIDSLSCPSITTVEYDADMKRFERPEMVPGMKNTDLLSQPMFKAGHKECFEKARKLLLFLASGKPRDLKKFAGIHG
jgi:hypothetical protein